MSTAIHRTPFAVECGYDTRGGHHDLIHADIRDAQRNIVGSVMVRPNVRPNEETERIANLWAAAPTGFALAADLATELNRGMRGPFRDRAIDAIRSGDLDAMTKSLAELKG